MLEAAALVAALTTAPCSHPTVPGRFDIQIEAAVRRYWPEHSRPFKCWWKAQLWAESRLDPGAASHVGAQGLAQIMPATFAETAGRLGVACSPYDAACSIKVGTAYAAQMLRMFSSPRPELDRLCWEAVSYNAGAGNALKAQRIGKTENCDEALAVWHEVTGEHAIETRGYIKRIRRWFIAMLRGGR